MMTKVDIALLPALDALLSEANVTRAAAKLGISQPALSAKLARLRDLTGDALLVPSGKGRGMVLTPQGKALRDRVRDALSSVDEALRERTGFDPTTSSATFRVIANDNAASLTIAVVLAELARSRGRQIRVALLPSDERRLADRLEEGDADLAISSEDAPFGGERLHRRMILIDRFATAQRRFHPRGQGPLDLDGFCSWDHLIVSDRGAFQGSIDIALRAEGRERRVSLSVHSYLLAPLVVARSDLLVTLPRRLLDQQAGLLDLFEPPIRLPEVTLKAFWHRRTDGDAANRWFRSCLFDAPAATVSH